VDETANASGELAACMKVTPRIRKDMNHSCGNQGENKSASRASDLSREIGVLHEVAAETLTLVTAFAKRERALKLKSDGTVVTDLDLSVDHIIASTLRHAFPRDAIVSEEGGYIGGTSNRTWVVDPIDGTQHMLSGACHWGTHLSLSVGDELTLALVTRPVGRSYWWTFDGASCVFRHDSGSDVPLRCSGTGSSTTLRIAGLTDGQLSSQDRPGSSYTEVESWPFVELLAGEFDAVIDMGGEVWDQTPWMLLVAEAGGYVVNGEGKAAFDKDLMVYCRTTQIAESVVHLVSTARHGSKPVRR
jgi:histidinol-phosphatase